MNSLAGVDLSLPDVDVEVGMGRAQKVFSVEAQFRPTVMMMSLSPSVCSAKAHTIPSPTIIGHGWGQNNINRKIVNSVMYVRVYLGDGVK